MQKRERKELSHLRLSKIALINFLVQVPARHVASDFDRGRANNNQVSTHDYLMPLVFKASSIKDSFF